MNAILHVFVAVQQFYVALCCALPCLDNIIPGYKYSAYKVHPGIA